jgi:transposase-like protein
MRRKDGRPATYSHPRYWTEAERVQAGLLVEEGLSPARIARALGRSVTAIEVWMKRHVKRRQVRPYTARRVAALLGVPCSKTVTWWIAEGYLREVRGHGLRAAHGQRHLVRRDMLIDFLKNRRYWHLWDPAKGTDAGLRDVVARHRPRGRFLTTRQVGARFAVGHRAVNNWIRCGLLPAVRRGNWLVWEGDLASFVPPCQRSKEGMRLRRWTVQEVATLCAMRSAGAAWEELARALDRTTRSVMNRWYDLRKELKAA